jgi:hypothetical protein
MKKSGGERLTGVYILVKRICLGDFTNTIKAGKASSAKKY